MLKDEVPSGWKLKYVADIAEVVGGSTPSRKQASYFNGDIPWATPTDVTNLNGRYLTATSDSITEKGLHAAGLRILPPNSLLLTSRASIGAVAINTVPVTTNQGFQSLIPKEEIDHIWLYYVMESRARELDRLASGSTFKEVSRNSLRNLSILLPPKLEQRRIAAILDSIDEAIERTEAVIEATEHLRKALLQELLTRGVPGWHSEWKEVKGIGTIPADWEVVTIGDVVTIRNGQVDPRKQEFRNLLFIAPDDLESETRTLVKRRTVAEAKAISGKYLFDKEDVIYSKIRPYLKKVFLPSESGLCSADMYPIKACQSMSREYLSWLLLSSHFDKYIKTCSDRTGIPKVNRPDLLKYRFALPSLSEQEKIVETLESMNLSREKHIDFGQHLIALKASASDALLSGRVRVPVPSSDGG